MKLGCLGVTVEVDFGARTLPVSGLPRHNARISTGISRYKLGSGRDTCSVRPRRGRIETLPTPSCGFQRQPPVRRSPGRRAYLRWALDSVRLLCGVSIDNQSHVRVHVAAGLDGSGMATAVRVRLCIVAGIP